MLIPLPPAAPQIPKPEGNPHPGLGDFGAPGAGVAWRFAIAGALYLAYAAQAQRTTVSRRARAGVAVAAALRASSALAVTIETTNFIFSWKASWRAPRLTLSLASALSQPHTGTAAVLRDELDAGFFEGSD